MDVHQALDARQQSIIPIAAFTANGDLAKLKPALQGGLDAGLTVNEIKEILVQLYAYTGFPRSLNGINTLMALMDERQAQGIEDEVGDEASPLPTDMDRAAYGANVRAKLAGWATIPPPGATNASPRSSTSFSKSTSSPIFSPAMCSTSRAANW